MIAKVTVVCDNPEHPKGRICTVAVYRRFEAGWEREVLLRPPAKRARRNVEEQRRRRVAQAAVAGDAEAMLKSGGIGNGPVCCQDCGAGLPVSRLGLEMRLETAAAEGESIITLCQLRGLS